jgi:arginyl-tRNA synthetase
VEDISLAGPGFINLRLKPEAKQSVITEALTQGQSFGRQPSVADKVLVEFVSANPTGPLHVGHGRQAALGDAICNLLDTQGLQVHREFYYNDAASKSTTWRCRCKPEHADTSPVTPLGQKTPTTVTTSPTSPVTS